MKELHEEIQEDYCETVMKLYQSCPDMADNAIARQASQEIYAKYSLSNRQIRRITSVFRDDDGLILPDVVIEYLDKEQGITEDSVDNASTSEDIRGNMGTDRVETPYDPEDISYDYDGVVYTVPTPNSPFRDEVTFTKEELENFMIDYSNMGSKGLTRNELATKWDMHLSEVIHVLNAFDHTHDNVPFPAETLAGEDSEELVDKIINNRKEVVEGLSKKDKEDARRFRNFKEEISGPLRDYIAGVASEPSSPPSIPLSSDLPSRDVCLVTAPYDLHYGMPELTDIGEDDVGRDATKNRLLKTAEKNIEDIFQYGLPKTVVICIGSDFCHINDDRGTTAYGTDIEVDGDPLKIFSEAHDVLVQYIQAYRMICDDIHIAMVPGNHDTTHSISSMDFIRAWYRSAADVTVHRSIRDRYYLPWANNMYMFHHGRGISYRDYGPIMADEKPELWAKCSNRYVIIGDKHTDEKRRFSNNGVMLFRLSSMANDDRYTQEGSWCQRMKRLHTYQFDAKKGYIGEIATPPVS